MKRIKGSQFIAMVLAVLMVFTAMPLTALTVHATTASGNTTEFAGGSGTADDPYLISTKEHLDNVRNYLTANFKMINDIEFADEDFAEGGAFYNNGSGWEPIRNFSGIFDGNFYAISNLYINGDKYVGLFGVVSSTSAIIKNICLTDCSITGVTEVGGICGRMAISTIYHMASSKIINCYVSGNVVATDGSAGGICGYYYNVHYKYGVEDYSRHDAFTQCYNAAVVSSRIAGGIVGTSCVNMDAIKMNLCCNTGIINGSDSTGCFVGYEESGYGDIQISTNCSENPYNMECFQLQGTPEIVGNSNYLSNVTANLSILTAIRNTFRYKWYIDGVEVANEIGYTLQAEDIGKKLKVEIISNHPLSAGSVFSEEIIVGKAVQTAAPAAPVVEMITNTSVTLQALDGYEYSMDGITWQESNVFEGLNAYTEYTFCQRIAENKYDYASAQSGYTIVVTLKNTVSAPAAPTVEKATATTVTLVDISGYEYSMDGTNWQTNNVFTGLTTLQTYTFYQRIKETNTDYTSESSAGTSFKVKYEAETPAAPVLVEKTNNKIVVAVNTGYEYSINQTTWTTTGEFTGLQPNKGYKVYCRIPETDTHYASAVSNAMMVITLKSTVNAPAAPVLSNKTGNSVTLVLNSTYEYSIDGKTWQASNVFSGLSPNTEYTFYQRMAETSTAYASEKSEGLRVTTPKNTVSAPAAPTLQSKTSTTITLNSNSGCEYSIDGVNWQASNVFTELKPNTTYKLYQRYSETSTSYVSDKSEALSVTTPKKTAETPAAPTLRDANATTIVLEKTEGFEYSKDGTTWQDSNVFAGLTANTQYSFYQRVKETDTTLVSEASPALNVKTAEKSACSIKPAAPIVAEYTSNKIVLVARDGYEYKIDNGSWTTNPTFTGLSSDTTYVVYQRIAECDEEYASASSEGVTVRTVTSVSGTSTNTNYLALQKYVLDNGFTTNAGNKCIEKIYSDDYGFTHILQITDTPTGLWFTFTTDGYGDNFTDISFTLSNSKKTIKISSTIRINDDFALNDLTVDRTTISKDSIYTLPKGGILSQITAAQATDLFNSQLQALFVFFERNFSPTLGFGLKGLGFSSYSGYGVSVCDPLSNYHITATTETRNAYSPTCTIDGYTGDTYCTSCGEKVSAGKIISCSGSHSYTNSCDKDCNACGEERRVTHTYMSDCDKKCDICNHNRIAPIDHTFDTEGVCTVCGASESIPGDVTGDEKINSLDGLLLMRYLNGWNVNVASPESMDVNGDGKVNSLDGLILMRYLNGWNVALG